VRARGEMLKHEQSAPSEREALLVGGRHSLPDGCGHPAAQYLSQLAELSWVHWDAETSSLNCKPEAEAKLCRLQ